jgi:hypothetical protein
MLFVEWHDEWCWNTGGVSDLGLCGSLQQSNSDAPHLQNYPEVMDGDKNASSNGNVIQVDDGYLDIPSPNDSRASSYCTRLNLTWPQATLPSCPSGQLLLANNNGLIQYTCYHGPTLGVKILKQIFYLGGGGTEHMNCGKETYYYAKDVNDPSITWGYVFYEYTPPSPSCSQWYQGCPMDCYKNEYFSTKYFPDLQPHIPNSAQEKH